MNFGIFGEDFCPYDDLDYLSNEELQQTFDQDLFKSELLGIASVFEKPFVLKGMICNYNIEFLDKIFEKAIFIYTRRNPLTNIESILEARKRQLGSINEWYSFKIKEYGELAKIEDPVLQVAGQVYYINNAVEMGLKKVSDERKLVVDYEKFCENPKYFYERLYEKLMAQDYKIDKQYLGPDSFHLTRASENNERILEAYNRFVHASL